MSGGEYQKARKFSFKLPEKYADLWGTFDTLTRYWWDYLDHKRHWAQHEAGKGTATVALTIASSAVTPNCRDSNVFRVVLTGNITFNNPTNPIGGQVCNITIKQDGTGGRTITWGSKVKVTGTIDSAASAASILSMQYDEIDDLWRGVISTGFA